MVDRCSTVWYKAQNSFLNYCIRPPVNISMIIYAKDSFSLHRMQNIPILVITLPNKIPVIGGDKLAK